MILHNVMWESRPLPKIVRKAPAARSAGAFFVIVSLPLPLILSRFPFLPSFTLPCGLPFCAQLLPEWGNFWLASPLPFAFSFRAEHVSLPLLVALSLLLGIVVF